MKYTILQKIKSVIYNLATTRFKDIYNYYIVSWKARKYLEERFAWDLTKPEHYDSRDYTLDWSEKLPKIDRNVKFMIDQSLTWRMRNSCVPMSMYLGLCHNCNITPDISTFNEYLNYLESEWVWVESRWASAPRVINKLVPRWNKLNPNNQVEYRRVWHNTEWYKELLEKWYALAWGRSTFPDYTKDLSDRIIDKASYSDENRRWGHYIGIMLWKVLKGLKTVQITSTWERIEREYDILTDEENIVNQYPTRNKQFNVYSHTQLVSHVKRKIWYYWFYAIIPKWGVQIKRIEDMQDEIDDRNIELTPNQFKKAVAWIEIIDNGLPKWFYKDIDKLDKDSRIWFDVANQYKQWLLKNFNPETYRDFK